ncbi:MAG TPA: DUF5318 family protein [Mycobacteriales bacterium]
MSTAAPRQVIDYALARRAVLVDLFAGRVSSTDVCDAHPYLLRAAKHHGEVSETRCPVCRHADPLIHVTYVYGDRLGDASGRARATSQLAAIAREYGEVRVYVVEVCPRCCWNHVVSSHVRGSVQPAADRRARSRAAGR